MIGDLGHGQPEGVVEDEDGALVRRQSPETAIQLIAVVDREKFIWGGRSVRLEQDNIGCEMPATPRFGVASVDEDAMEPRIKSIKVAQGRKLPPHLDEGHLDRVLGEVGVPQDPMRDVDAAVADLANQGGERFFVAAPRLIHDASEHRFLLAVDARERRQQA
jgi:hypothetical protein